MKQNQEIKKWQTQMQSLIDTIQNTIVPLRPIALPYGEVNDYFQEDLGNLRESLNSMIEYCEDMVTHQEAVKTSLEIFLSKGYGSMRTQNQYIVYNEEKGWFNIYDIEEPEDFLLMSVKDFQMTKEGTIFELGIMSGLTDGDIEDILINEFLNPKVE